MTVAQDDAEAVKWYRLALDQGFVFAQHELGVMYANGTGVAKDSSEAVKWFRLAAGKGFTPAQYNLAVRYETGAGLPQDEVQALARAFARPKPMTPWPRCSNATILSPRPSHRPPVDRIVIIDAFYWSLSCKHFGWSSRLPWR